MRFLSRLLTAVSGTLVLGAAVPSSGTVAEAWRFYLSRPVFEQPVTGVERIPQGLTSVTAKSCGVCHQAIFEEWSISTHRHAWTHDAQFQEELKKNRGTPGKTGDLGWLCVNCHTPVLNQLPRVVVSLHDGALDQPVYANNPIYDAELQDEAISCATCHIRDGVVLTPHDVPNAPHATRQDASLSSAETCLRCHQAEAQFPQVNLGCFFSTGREWSAGPFAAAPCQACHMPEVTRKTAENADVPVRKTRRHWFGGSLIAKQPQWEAALVPLRGVYGSGVEVLVESGFTVDQGQRWPTSHHAVNRAQWGEACAFSQGCVVARVVTRNHRAGHHFPTGDPERHAVITAQVLDASGQTVATARDEIGSRYQWWPDIRLLTDTRIAAGGQREFWVVAPRNQRPMQVSVTAEKFRMYADAFAHHQLEGRAQRGRTFATSTWTLGQNGQVRLVTQSTDLTGP